MKTAWWLTFALGASWIAAGEEARAAADAGFLVRDGRANYAIVVRDDAAQAERTAAQELRDHLARMSGAELAVVPASEHRGGRMIAVGFNEHLPAALQPEAIGPLAPQELVIQPGPDALLLAGGSPLGTLYAVYEYLHRLGVRWYTPAYTKVPDLPSIPAPREAYRFSPPVIGRNLNVGNGADAAWMARNRMTEWTLWRPVGVEYGSPFAEGPDMHTFWRVLKRGVLEQHPDWLSEIDGKRELPVGSTWGLCLSNPEVRAYIVEQTVNWAREHPQIGTVWVGQNDGSDYCTCAQCRAFYDAHGGRPSSLVVQLVNELADALAAELPGRHVKTLAYGWTLEPPEGMELRENVVVMFCPAGNFFNPIETDPKRAELRAAMEDWGRIAHHMDAYLYFPSEDYWTPSPCTYAGAENIAWCSANGTDHLYAAVSGWGGSHGSESMDLRGWMYARLMWDPSESYEELMDEFVTDYYGPAADTVLDAIRLVHTDILDEDGMPRVYNESAIVPHHVDPEKIRRINRAFEEQHASMQDEVYRNRLEFAWIPYLWADVWLGYTGTGRYDPAGATWSVPLVDGELRNRYARLAKQFMSEQGVNTLGERKKMDPQDLGIDKMGIPWEAHLLKKGAVEAVVVPGLGGHVLDFQNRERAFAPFRPMLRGLAMRYPMFSSTEDGVNGTEIPAYSTESATASQVVLQAERDDCSVVKEVSLTGGELASRLRVTAKEGTDKLLPHQCVMFDLGKNVFGSHPTLSIERADGTWDERVLGVETDFWWIEEFLDLREATGRMVLACENRPEAVFVSYNPDEVEKIYFWYNDYTRGPVHKHSQMFRLFFYGPARAVQPGDGVDMGFSLTILPGAEAIARVKQAG
ncbi:MAG: DUF4838 domain-containing protein [Candidatus Hydrogenedentes bacterium]|nr:DUF4838 domain-containing protein [Candidatus Hydrogenedentota bacterium]